MDDLTIWHNKKAQLNKLDTSKLFFKEREIWWCYLGQNVGMEQNGKGSNFARPVLIIRKYSKTLCSVVPLSNQVHSGTYFFSLLAESNEIRVASLHHMRTIDVRRLINKIDTISKIEFNFIKEKITALLR